MLDVALSYGDLNLALKPGREQDWHNACDAIEAEVSRLGSVPVGGVGRPANCSTGPPLEPGVPYLGNGLKTKAFTSSLVSK